MTNHPAHPTSPRASRTAARREPYGGPARAVRRPGANRTAARREPYGGSIRPYGTRASRFHVRR
ncbi:hypothetical protein [Bailinhaonella thermotolerans]|uniref:hypothetical protein n=1 Tax=Bailinhaonella thermotolerans TaxID=1070861 RepID=UPI0011C3CA59|nr:hypothetical protein [Bailinhaonella thermotolerans]